MFLTRQSRLHSLRGFGRRRSLGASTPVGPKVTGVLAPIAGIGTTVATSSALGTWAGPVGAAVGALVGIIAGLWAGHDARVAGAKSENTALNSAVATWDAVMQAIFAAVNSTNPSQNITAAQAQQQVQAAYQQFWSSMCPFTKQAGAADTSNCGTNCGNGQINPSGPCAGTLGGHQCDKSCTATCCVGCQAIYPSMLQAIQVLQSPSGGTVQVCTANASSYGFTGRPGYTLTYTPPSGSSVAGAADSIASGSISSIPLWVWLVGGGVGIYLLARR